MGGSRAWQLSDRLTDPLRKKKVNVLGNVTQNLALRDSLERPKQWKMEKRFGIGKSGSRYGQVAASCERYN